MLIPPVPVARATGEKIDRQLRRWGPRGTRPAPDDGPAALQGCTPGADPGFSALWEGHGPAVRRHLSRFGVRPADLDALEGGAAWIARPIMTGLSLLARPPFTMQFFNGAPNASRWLAENHGAACRAPAPRILAAVEALRISGSDRGRRLFSATIQGKSRAPRARRATGSRSDKLPRNHAFRALCRSPREPSGWRRLAHLL
jgi:hypothetical protein